MPEAMDDALPDPPKTRTSVVLALLLLAAGLFSYLGAYAVSGALVGAGVLEPWPPDADPRPGWMLTGFCIMLGLLAVPAVLGFIAGERLAPRHIEE